MKRDAIVALDLGTSSCRALVFAAGGQVLGRAQETYPLLQPHTGWAEQDPEELVAAAGRVIRGAVAAAQLASGDVAALSLGTYFHSLLALDASGRCLSPVITWADTRSTAEADALRSAGLGLYPRTGCPPHPMYPLAKLLWLRGHQPDLWGSTPRWGSVKDLLIERLTGVWAVDHSIASGSGIFRMERLDWDEDALALTGLERRQLPQLLPTTQTLPLAHCGAGLTGLPAGLPVVLGAGDGALSNLGAGAVGPGVMAAMVGTSGALRVTSPSPRVDPEGRSWCYNVTPDLWLLGGAISNGGVILKWLRDRWLQPGATYDDITASAGRVPLGAGGLIFLPLLAGERSPFWNARARGVLLGLGLEHGPDHMARAALEGVAFRLNSVREALESLAGPAAEVRATGGLSRSALWVQICADVFGRTVTVGGESEGSATGAFLLARHALGAEPDLAAAGRYSAREVTYTPDPQRHALYERLYAIYLDAYWSLQRSFASLAEFREAGS